MSDDVQDFDPHGLDELLGAYALDAVDDLERARVEDYLEINPRAAAEVAQHREVATMLAYTGMDAPSSVWKRIEQELDSSERAPAPGPELAKLLGLSPVSGHDGAERNDVVADEQDRDVVDLGEVRARRWARPAAWVASVAAAVVLTVVAVGVIDDSSGSDGDPVQLAFDQALADDAARRTELVAESSDASAVGVIDGVGHGFIDASDLPALDPDQTYQLWGVLADGGEVVSMGILGSEPGVEPFTLDGDVSALAITIEQSPGVVSDGNPDGAYVGAFG